MKFIQTALWDDRVFKWKRRKKPRPTSNKLLKDIFIYLGRTDQLVDIFETSFRWRLLKAAKTEFSFFLFQKFPEQRFTSLYVMISMNYEDYDEWTSEATDIHPILVLWRYYIIAEINLFRAAQMNSNNDDLISEQWTAAEFYLRSWITHRGGEIWLPPWQGIEDEISYQIRFA